jgi:uncharacterized protein with FMN-binding domain
MPRAPYVIAATAAGFAATLGFHARKPAVATATPPAATATATATATTTATATATASSAAGRTVTSDAVGTRYGNVQLKVTISGGRITRITPVQLPSFDPKSYAISSYAAPLLRQSALAKQSADIDLVSGATYTSEGYKSALQSALDKAGFHA